MLWTYNRAGRQTSYEVCQTADGSGYDNLVLAGDWTDNGLNAGCIEAATLGGLQAANAIKEARLDAGTSGGYLPLGAPDPGAVTHA